MKKMISIGLWIVGGLLFLIALVSGGVSILSLLERMQHGPGLLFADVEIFGFIALIAVILGAATLFAAKKLSTFWKPDVPPHNPTDD
jgi:formate-dependent nitrite reductase membrane component NrfD